MPTQEIPLGLDHLLQEGGVVYWQAKQKRKFSTILSPWADKILGEKINSLSEEEDWFESVHPLDQKKVISVVKKVKGTEVYSVDYRWMVNEDAHVWLREVGKRSEIGSDTFEGILYSIREEKELEKKALNISEREKRKLGRELHDDLCQQLAGMLFFTNNLVYQIKTGKDPETLVQATNEIKKQLQISIEKTRCLSHGLNPVSLDRKTFQECLVELIQQSQTLYSIDCQFEMSSNLTVHDPEMARHLFRITQESINNSIRHAQATIIRITLQKEKEFGILTIRDNGSGFKADPKTTNCMGLHNLRSRAGMINAFIDIGNHEEGGAYVYCKFDPDPTKL